MSRLAMPLERRGRLDDRRSAVVDEIAGRGRLRRIFSAVTWPYVLGFSLAQTWTVLCIALPDPVTYGEPFLDLRWVSLTTALLLSLATALRRDLGDLVSRSRRFFLAVGAVASAASLLGPLSALFPTRMSGVLIYLAAVGVGTGFAWLYLAWYARFCAICDMMGLACSVVVSLFFTYPLANVLSTDQISPWISSVVGSVLPLLSASLSLAAGADGRPGANDEDARRPEGSRPGTAAAPRGGNVCGDAAGRGLEREQRLLCLRFGLCLCAVVAVVETVRNILLGGTAIAFYAGVANLGGAALKVACAAWLVVVFDRRDARGVSVAYRFAFILLIGVVLCVSFLLQGNWLAHMLLDVGSFFFQMVVLMVAYQITIGFKVAPTAAFGLARAVWAAGALLGIVAAGLRQTFGPETVQLLPFVLGIVASVAFLFVFTDRDCVEVLASMPRADGVDLFEAKTRRLAERHGVSEREFEVMGLVAKGRSAPRIAEHLGVSLATVNSHIHHIYRKLGVHSRQELIDCIERERVDATEQGVQAARLTRSPRSPHSVPTQSSREVEVLPCAAEGAGGESCAEYNRPHR